MFFESKMNSEEMANVAGTGNIAGIGVGPDGEPGFTKRKNPLLSIIQKRKELK